MDRVEQIENAIVADSDDLFEDAGIRANLHVTIRIARDFYDFLVKFGESPDAYEIDYLMGTIRSGIDEFALLAYACQRIEGSRWTKSFDAHKHWDFSALRERFMSDFERLADRDISVLDRLDSLFSLTHLELVFLAQHFPSTVFADAPDGSRSISEVESDLSESLADIREMQAGRLSVVDANARAQARRTKRTS